jgi:hypothetical protein
MAMPREFYEITKLQAEKVKTWPGAALIGAKPKMLF